MAHLPKKVYSRLQSALRKFQPILESARTRDVNESDTVLIVTDLLSEMFGYDKFMEITSEYSIRSTYCDLALVVEGSLHFLVEVKAIGSDLKDNHIRQAVDYAANEGVDWVLLTNGARWQAYKVSFSKPISHEMVVDFDLLGDQNDIQTLFLFTREAIRRSALPEYLMRAQATNRFCLGAIILSAPVVNLIRRQLRRINPDVKIESEQIREALASEVLKREVVQDDRAKEAARKVQKAASKKLRSTPATAMESAESGVTQ